MSEKDPYTDAITWVCEYYNITKEECVEHYWDEVESMMSIFPILYINKNNDESY